MKVNQAKQRLVPRIQSKEDKVIVVGILSIFIAILFFQKKKQDWLEAQGTGKYDLIFLTTTHLAQELVV